MVRPERFELPAFWFVARRSIQLSYGRTAFESNPNCSTHYIQLVSASGGLYPAELRAHCVFNNLRLAAFRSTACVVGTVVTKIAVRDGVIVAASRRCPQISAWHSGTASLDGWRNGRIQAAATSAEIFSRDAANTLDQSNTSTSIISPRRNVALDSDVVSRTVMMAFASAAVRTSAEHWFASGFTTKRFSSRWRRARTK